jgi:predicted amidohydrolase YtcJ
MLHEDAIPWARDRLPATTDATRMLGLRAAMQLANSHGITGVIDPRVEPHNTAIYAQAEAAGELTLRVGGAALVTPHETAAEVEDRLRTLRASHCGTDFRVHSAKLFLDGVLENRTAAMIAPYADAQGGNAPVMFPPDLLRDLAIRLDAARFQLHFHAIGDAAVRAALDAVETAQVANGAWPALHQIAHLQVVDPADLPRLAELGVMANIQPLWARHDPVVPDDWMAMLGSARLPHAYAFQSMLDAGADWCLSSDWPVTTLNPLAIIETAVTRQPQATEGRRPPFEPRQRMSVAQAVAGYTWQAARACWRSGWTGRLRPGFSADLIVLDRDILAVPAREIGGTQVMLTLFKGRVVHRASGFDG